MMNKLKLQKKGGIVLLVVKSRKGQRLDEREIHIINNAGVRGLLSFESLQKKDAFKLIFDLTGYISLREYLKNPFRKENFAKLLQNIFDNLKAMRSVNFRPQKLVLDMDYVMINPSTQELQFVYLPIQALENGTELRSFLLEIIREGSFVADEDREYVREYITILNTGINFSEFELEQYIERLQEKEPDMQRIKCPKCKTQVGEEDKFCPVCGSPVAKKKSMDSGKIYMPPDSTGGAYEAGQTDNDTQAPVGRKKGTTEYFTTVLGPEPERQEPVYGGTAVLGGANKHVLSYLIRESTQERISVDKPVFRIGKEKSYCDYFVKDNSAVSRSHANIIVRGERYYVVDLNSTNHTYVDGRLIQPQEETEIFSGTRLRLGNEEFTFYIEESR